MTKVCIISDTHLRSYVHKLPEADILIHCGDLTFDGTPRQIVDSLVHLEKTEIPTIIVVPGNHDLLAESNPDWFREMCESRGIIPLIHEFKQINGFKVFGTAYQPYFFDWAFNVDDSHKLSEYYKDIPENLDILITHCPPSKILDICPSGSVGSPELAIRVAEVKPRYHFFGHIHESYGQLKTEHTHFVNASHCNGRYEGINPPILLTID